MFGWLVPVKSESPVVITPLYRRGLTLSVPCPYDSRDTGAPLTYRQEQR